MSEEKKLMPIYAMIASQVLILYYFRNNYLTKTLKVIIKCSRLSFVRYLQVIEVLSFEF